MSKPSSSNSENAGETTLHGKNLHGSEQKDAPTHLAYARKRNPDTTLRVDGEDDTLYNDGLELDDNDGSLAETRGADHHT